MRVVLSPIMILSMGFALASCAAKTGGEQSAKTDAAGRVAAAPAPSEQPASEPEKQFESAALPSGFNVHEAQKLSNGDYCVVGAMFSTDDLSEKPAIYVVSGDRDTVVWTRTPDLRDGFHQARLTHCLQTERGLLALLQSDSSRATPLSQTFLDTIEFDAKTGEKIGGVNLKPEGVNAPYTAWVEPGRANFRFNDGALEISGKYSLLSDRDAIRKFVLKVLR